VHVVILQPPEETKDNFIGEKEHAENIADTEENPKPAMDENIEAFQRIRQQQDREYAESLAIDQQKVPRCV
jgi:hypothetical protein